jgi:exosortase A-associated hydrolase 2
VPRLQAFFLPMEQGHRFCLLLEPPDTAPTRGAVLLVHAFAEEMNNTRRIAAVQTRAFADAGWTVLQIDLFGCGDSAGDFGDATWLRWLTDVLEAAEWLRKRTDRQPVLWGVRVGCLLAAEAASRMLPIPSLLLWQPVISGKQFLQQFLRLKIAQQIIAATGEQFTGTTELRQRLDSGETIVIAGYALSAALAAELERAQLELPPAPTRVAWIEISRSADLSPAARQNVQRLRDAGHDVRLHTISASAFWQIPGIGECPALVAVSVAALEAFLA